MTPFVSIVVVGRNVERTLAECLDSISQLNYPTFEILYIDDGSEDRSIAIARRFSSVQQLASQGRGPSAARNLGIRQAHGDFVAFTDADCTVDRNWLKELVEQLSSHPEVAGVGGRQQPSLRACDFELELYAFMESVSSLIDYVRSPAPDAAIPVAHNPSCNVLYRRDALMHIGGFREHLWPGEDVDLDYRFTRNGQSLLYHAKAIVFHDKPKNLSDWIAMMNRYGWAQGVLCRIHGVFRRLHFVALLTPLLLLFSSRWLRLKVSPIVAGVSIVTLLSQRLQIAITGSTAWLIGFLTGVTVPPDWTKQQQRDLQPLITRST
ncbi:MAG TPA: glycosyltransferase [Candidatus Ozemobacteraceae bacterium]|nr:glycosyltransferase [Candidatus Ozemobacteraceae bacterium]